MRLELGEILIKDVQFGDVSKVENGTLFINRDEIVSLVMENEYILDSTCNLLI